MAHFIGMVHRAQSFVARDSGAVAFSHGRQALVRHLQAGHTVFFYAPRSDFEGDPVQAFVAHATVTGDAPYKKFGRSDSTAWVRAAAFAGGSVRPMLDDPGVVKNTQHSGMTFRGGKSRIPPDDCRSISNAVGVS